MIRIVGMSGSLRRESFNTAALHAAAELLPPDVAMTVASIGDLPFYNEDVRLVGYPETVQRLRAQIETADAVLIATPEYNYSVPGVLKNAIDWASRRPNPSFYDKPVAIMGASSGIRGTVRGQLHLRQILAGLNAHVLPKPELMIGNAATLIGANGRISDVKTREEIAALMAALTAWVLRLRHAATV